METIKNIIAFNAALYFVNTHGTIKETLKSEK